MKTVYTKDVYTVKRCFTNGGVFNNSAGNNNDTMTQDEFDAKMARGLAQAKTGEGIQSNDFFDSLKQETLQVHD